MSEYEPEIRHVGGDEYRVAVPHKNAAHSGAYHDVFSGSLFECKRYAQMRDWPVNIVGVDASGAAQSDDRPAPDATPAAQDLAAKKGVDLATVTGTLTDGKIGVDDVRKAAKSG